MKGVLLASQQEIPTSTTSIPTPPRRQHCPALINTFRVLFHETLLALFAFTLAFANPNFRKIGPPGKPILSRDAAIKPIEQLEDRVKPPETRAGLE
jgi:hypothetical protein